MLCLLPLAPYSLSFLGKNDTYARYARAGLTSAVSPVEQPSPGPPPFALFSSFCCKEHLWLASRLDFIREGFELSLENWFSTEVSHACFFSGFLSYHPVFSPLCELLPVMVKARICPREHFFLGFFFSSLFVRQTIFHGNPPY